MKKIINTICFFPSVLFLFITVLSVKQGVSQEWINNTKSENQYYGNNANDFYDISGLNKINKKSPLQSKLEKEIQDYKSQNYSSNANKIEELNRQIENISGNTVTKYVPYNGGQMKYVNEPLPHESGDEINNIRLFNNTSREIKGMAVCTEQIGANAGRIWVFYNFSANITSPDSFKVIYSINNGASWIVYVTGNIAPLDKVNYDDLDMELTENTSGSKYLTVVYGLRANGGTGRWFTGGLAINITSFNGSFFSFAWPGDDPAKRYYNIRITSDNASYLSNPYLYVICSFDSSNTSNVRVNTQKYARCLNPYTAAPSFTYQGEKFWWFSSAAPDNYERTLFSDIAYFKNGTADSVVVSFSNVPDSTRIYFSKADINGNQAIGNGTASPTGSDAAAQKQWARLSSNGNDNGSVICVFRQFTDNNWNIKYFRTTNYGNFNDMFESILLGSSTNVNYQPDIIGKRNGSSHYFTFNTSDSVHHLQVTSAGIITHVQKVNLVSPVSVFQGSKPGIRNLLNDSCFTLYSEAGQHNVWSAVGCSGEIIGINSNNKSLPSEYSLSQNYPNPFNPTTKIKLDIPPSNGASGMRDVKLIIYDILGKEISVLINEHLTPGIYEVEWNAFDYPSGVYFYKLITDNFTDTKKMLLIK